MTTTTSELDYWWLVRDSTGDSARAGGAATLGPALQALVTTPPEPSPHDFGWGERESAHFRYHFVPGTAAERDLGQLETVAEASLAHISRKLDLVFEGQMSLYFVPRIFWQGGVTYGDKVQMVSYLDRNYTNIATWTYFTHEGVHALAQDLVEPKEEGGPDGVLVEGLAVWASGGHYEREPIDAWAAVIAGSEDYIPLGELRAGPFYDFQHETSYLEAASFVKFLVARYGLDRFKELYAQATGDEAHDETLVNQLYGLGYADLEAQWLAYLARLTPSAGQAEAWRFRVRYFELMRRYQSEMEPDARILPPDPPTEWTSDTLKIFTRRIDAPANIVLETTLMSAQARLQGRQMTGQEEADPEGAHALLEDVEAALDSGGALVRPSLRERLAILALLSLQDQAVLRADASTYRDTLAPSYAQDLGNALEETLQRPYTEYRQEVVRLDIAEDGSWASGQVLVHAQVFGGIAPDDGHVFAVRLAHTDQGWRLAAREPADPMLSLPPGASPAAAPTPEQALVLPWPVWHWRTASPDAAAGRLLGP
jgi:hypothetical protein